MYGLEEGWEVNNLEYWLTAKIYDVNNNIEIKVVVIFKGELKSARGFLVHLAVMAVLYKMSSLLAPSSSKEIILYARHNGAWYCSTFLILLYASIGTSLTLIVITFACCQNFVNKKFFPVSWII